MIEKMVHTGIHSISLFYAGGKEEPTEDPDTSKWWQWFRDPGVRRQYRLSAINSLWGRDTYSESYD
jgi:hypothetical protein